MNNQPKKGFDKYYSSRHKFERGLIITSIRSRRKIDEDDIFLLPLIVFRRHEQKKIIVNEGLI